ncbi:MULTISPECIES: MFS transporter [unclassified Pseudoalteromonas]|uniref:MFS transporter n=1 Tax=unclassified Pseudoalteromonas TaxID=194690 RepID=UPI0014078FAE|nr:MULTISPECIES: MFS transporter [unclassified Pseudoalteromonas]MBH0027540.1 MFS transporter [Pseudoalteromonas sp. SWN29]
MFKLPTTTIALIIICSGSIIGPLGMAGVNIAIPNLAEDLHANAKMIAWMPTLYLLSSVMFMLPCGKMADNYGRKRVYAFGLGLNAVASLMCALATSIEWVLFWRFIQGAAGAMIFGIGVAIITSVTPDNKRGMALGTSAACVYIGLSAAPAVGGWLTEMWGWRAVFYSQIPLVLLLLAAIKLFLHGEWKNDKKSPFDWWGTIIFSLFALFLVLGLSDLPDIAGWLLTVLSITCLMLFIVHQSRSRRPLIRVQMFLESRVFSLSLTTSFLMYASNFSLAFLLSLYLQYIKGLSPAHAGQIILLQAVSMAIMAPLAGRLADRVQPRLLATLGCIIVLVGFFLLSRLSISSSTVYISGSLLLLGVGFGLFSTPNNNAIMGAIDKSELGVASSSMNLSRTIGNLFGMSIINLIVHYYLGDSTFSAQNGHALMSTISLAFTVSLGFVILASCISALRGRA